MILQLYSQMDAERDTIKLSSVKFWGLRKVSSVAFAYNCYFLCTFAMDCNLLVYSRWCQTRSFMMTDKAACAVLSMAESYSDKAIRSGHWVGKTVQDILRRLLDAVFETHWNLAISQYLSLERSNGRCPRLWYIYPKRPVSHYCIRIRIQYCCHTCLYRKVIHIGVGSDVVCST